MLTFKRYDDEEAAKGADIALKNRLYVSGWSLSGTLKAIRKNSYGHSVCLAFYKDEPVAVVIKEKHNGTTMVFTKKCMRRKGIASSLIKETNLKVGNWNSGVDGSENFWRKVKQTS